MCYKLVISERAEMHIDSILDYVVNVLNNPGANTAIVIYWRKGRSLGRGLKSHNVQTAVVARASRIQNKDSNTPASTIDLRRGPCVSEAHLWEDLLGLFYCQKGPMCERSSLVGRSLRAIKHYRGAAGPSFVV